MNLRLKRAVYASLKEARRGYELHLTGLKSPSRLTGELAQRLDFLHERLNTSVAGMVDRYKRRLESGTARLSGRNFSTVSEMNRNKLLAICSRLEYAVAGKTDRLRESVSLNCTALQKLSPLATLGRGYSMAYRSADRRLVTDSSMIETGDRIDLYFAKGAARCIVETALPSPLSSASPSTAPADS